MYPPYLLPLSDESKRLIVYPLAIRKIGLKKSWILHGIGNKPLFSEEEKKPILREAERLYHDAKNLKDILSVFCFFCTQSLKKCIQVLVPWLNEEKSEANIFDYCPRCGYPSKITPENSAIPVQETKGEWRCPNCEARREWSRSKAQEQIWVLYKSWLLGINTYKRPLIIRKMYAQVAHCLARSLAWIAPVRFCAHHTCRIGHLVLDTAMTVMHKKHGDYPEGLDIPGYNRWHRIVSNTYLLEKWFASFDHSHLAALLPHFSIYSTFAPMWTEAKIETLLHDADPVLTFTEEENAYALEYLKKMGIPEGGKFITLLCRDAAYIQSIYPHIDISCRNVDIDTYQLACEYLASQGYFILRMGAKQEKRLTWANERIIDYAFEYRSEFMDLWLLSNCYFGITSGSGPDHICMLAKRHLLVTNNIPSNVHLYASNPNCIQLFKKFYKKDSSCVTPSITEILGNPENYFPYACTHNGILLFTLLHEKNSNYFRCTENAAERDIIVEDNSPEELLEATKDMVDLVNGRFSLSPEEKARQEYLWQIAKSIYKPDCPFFLPAWPYHGFFARQYTKN